MTNLNWISLKKNKLKNVNKLSKFSNLKHICLDYNEISDLENLSCLLFLAVTNKQLFYQSNHAEYPIDTPFQLSPLLVLMFSNIH